MTNTQSHTCSLCGLKKPIKCDCGGSFTEFSKHEKNSKHLLFAIDKAHNTGRQPNDILQEVKLKFDT